MNVRLPISLLLPLFALFFPPALDAQENAEAPPLSPAAKDDSGYEQMAVFTRALQLIRQDYVDDSRITYESLMQAALRGMLQSLDPHSQFMEPEDFKGMQEDTNSRFDGLGVVLAERDEKLIIVSLIEDTPSFKSGLLPGDVIMKIDGVPTDKAPLARVVERLKGAPGQKVALTIYRPSAKEYKDFELTREVVRLPSVKQARLLDRGQTGEFKIGYARITQFNVPTAEELSKRLDDLEAQGMQAFVLDLRFNPGGLLGSAVEVAGQFLDPGKLVVSTEGRMPSQSKLYRVPGSVKPRAKYPVAVLINNGSASGSEIVAGALKDYNRALLVGETTFGKGSVQSVIQLQDGSALRLTTAKYYTPSKNVIHEHGVAPTLRATMTPEQERQLIYSRREDIPPDEMKEALKNFRDTQLDRAVDALKSVMIYADRSTPGRKPAVPAN
jgi:carboxyl-terminal processing protease